MIKDDDLREAKVSDRLAAVLRRMLVRGEIPEGTILSPESGLMALFRVSRPTLREAFRVLESESLIKMERGTRGGARVHRPCQQTLARYAGLILEYEGVTLRDVHNARVTIEEPVIVQLAKDRPPALIAQLEAIVEREATLQPGSEAVDQLADFHAAIAQLSRNKTLRMINEMLHHIAMRGNCSVQATTGAPAERAVRRSAKTHRTILDLVKRGEAERAGELWSAHLRSAEEFLFNGAELATVVDLLE
jgi:GntR family transcriptional repressor for pyruvate dehydrogenase complex